jgi:class 3 adenylate cyclase
MTEDKNELTQESDVSKHDEPILDSENMILETQKRVWGALKKGYEYSGVVDESDQFLRKNVFSKLDMVVLYVDLVGSTTMALEMPADKIAIIISSFAQEMAAVIRQHQGYVLKFVGDAVIGYFVGDGKGLLSADNAVSCAKSMISVIQKGINPILNQYDYPDLMVKIGVDFGQNIVVRYGADVENSHVDLMGPAMNIAAKIQNMAKPNQILIGNDVYERLHPKSQKEFVKILWKKDEWKYRSRITGEFYNVYEYRG